MSSTNFALLFAAVAFTVINLALSSRIASRIAGYFRGRPSDARPSLEDTFVEAVLSSRSPHSLRMG